MIYFLKLNDIGNFLNDISLDLHTFAYTSTQILPLIVFDIDLAYNNFFQRYQCLIQPQWQLKIYVSLLA